GLPPTGEVPGGLYSDVRLADDAEQLGLILHRGDEKDPGPDIFVDAAALRSAQELSDNRGSERWPVSGSTTRRTQRPDLASGGGGDLRAARACGGTRDAVVWATGVPLPGGSYALHVGAVGGWERAGGAGTGGEAFQLTVDMAGAP